MDHLDHQMSSDPCPIFRNGPIFTTSHMKIPRQGDVVIFLSTTQMHQEIKRNSAHGNMLLLICYCCSVTKSWSTLCDPMAIALQASLSFTISQSLLKFMSLESVMLSNHLSLCRPRLLLPSVSPSIRIFSSESALCIRGPKYWSFSFRISPSNECSGLISFRTDWFDLLTEKRKPLISIGTLT